MKSYNVAILGATGLVGQEFLKVLDRRKFPVKNLKLLASSRTAGSSIDYKGQAYRVEEAVASSFEGVDILLSSAGEAISRELAPEAAKRGAVVIDNTNAFRMDSDVPLVVPEVNGHTLKTHRGIIANPNCSTAQLVLVLKPLHDQVKIRRVVVATYQSVSGAGKEAVEELFKQASAVVNHLPAVKAEALPHSIAFNLIPQIDQFMENGYTKEEMKMTNETQKILGDESVALTATCVRVPVARGHSEAVNIEFVSPMAPQQARALLEKAPGIKVVDDPASRLYPMPLDCVDREETFVGRIRGDVTHPNALNLWCVSDNIWKGAALNAVQIAEEMIRQKLI